MTASELNVKRCKGRIGHAPLIDKRDRFVQVLDGHNRKDRPEDLPKSNPTLTTQFNSTQQKQAAYSCMSGSSTDGLATSVGAT